VGSGRRGKKCRWAERGCVCGCAGHWGALVVGGMTCRRSRAKATRSERTEVIAGLPTVLSCSRIPASTCRDPHGSEHKARSSAHQRRCRRHHHPHRRREGASAAASAASIFLGATGADSEIGFATFSRLNKRSGKESARPYRLCANLVNVSEQSRTCKRLSSW
jgi:hypothetical protein